MPAQRDCMAAPVGDDPAEHVEVPRKLFDLVVFYARNLAVPARPEARVPVVLRGKQLFAEAGCAACHIPQFVTGKDPARPELSGDRKSTRLNSSPQCAHRMPSSARIKNIK